MRSHQGNRSHIADYVIVFYRLKFHEGSSGLNYAAKYLG
jgi:hypothetical protein